MGISPLKLAMAQQFQRNRVQSHHPHGGSQSSVTLVPEHLVLSSGSCMHIQMLRQNSSKHRNKQLYKN